jgi:hypothetical protein
MADLPRRISTAPKLYSRHRCARKHETHRELAQCMWRAEQVSGDGPYALVSRCRGVAVELCPTEAELINALISFDSTGCGASGCRGAHDLIQLVDPAQARQWDDRPEPPPDGPPGFTGSLSLFQKGNQRDLT